MRASLARTSLFKAVPLSSVPLESLRLPPKRVVDSSSDKDATTSSSSPAKRKAPMTTIERVVAQLSRNRSRSAGITITSNDTVVLPEDGRRLADAQIDFRDDTQTRTTATDVSNIRIVEHVPPKKEYEGVKKAHRDLSVHFLALLSIWLTLIPITGSGNSGERCRTSVVFVHLHLH